MKNLYLGIFVVAVLGLIGFAIFSNQNTPETLGVDTATTDSVAEKITPTLPITNSPDSMSKKQYTTVPKALAKDQISGKKATITVKGKGDITFEFFTDAPLAASNFIFLARDKFYDNLTFHRVVADFVIQGGDPTGTGSGGPGYKFEDEPVGREYDRGIVAMANAGPNTNGSQFFIMLKNNPLPPNYTIFGRVTQGMDVVDKVVVGDVMEKVVIE